MPTYPNQITLGEGKFRARLSVEGWPEIFVSDSSLVRTLAAPDLRSQILGLDPQTIRIAASVDLMRAKLTESEQTIEIIDDSEVVHGYVLSSGSVTASLSQKPPNTTTLALDLAVSATTATVASTAGFASSGTIHLGLEAIKYTGKSGTTFTGLTRGHWDTTDQAHFVGDGANLAYPKVTDRPRTMRGRRVLIYLYGNADSDTSDGTLRWRGIARTDVSYREGRYSFAIEPMSWLFEQPLGGDLEEPIPIRGIYLPSVLGLAFQLVRLGTASRTGAFTTDTAEINLSGIWTDNEDLTDDITAAIATATSGWTWDASARITAQSDGPSGWKLVYETGSSTADYVWAYIYETEPGIQGASLVDTLDPISNGLPADWIDTLTGSGLGLTAMGTGQRYTLRFDAPIPRAILGREGRGATHGAFMHPAGLFPAERLYLGGNLVPTTNMMAAVLPEGTGEVRYSQTDSVDTSNRYLVLQRQPVALLGPRTLIRLARKLAANTNLEGLITALIANSPGSVNTGAMPLITPDDIDVTGTGIDEAARDLRVATRTWITSEGISLSELFEHEARLIGVYPAPDADGTIAYQRLRPPLPTDVAAFTLASSSIVGFPSVARANVGHLREVIFRQGWDAIESEHTGLTVRVRDVQGADPTPLGGVLEVAPRSLGAVGDMGLEIDPLDAQTLGMVVLGMFGGAYRTVTVDATLVHFEATLGSTGVISTTLIPDDDGTMGLTTKEALLVGYDWSPFEGRGSLTLHLSELNIGGYSPSMIIASEVDNGSDNWTLTPTTTGYTTQDVDAWFAVGDEVRVIQRHSASPTKLQGTVTAATSTTVTVTFDSTWTVGASDWYIAWDTTANVDETAPSGRRWAQIKFAKIGGADGKTALGSGDVEAQDFSP
jgi:hypothetical protein